MAKATKAQRAADLKVRFARIKSAIQVTDQLTAAYFDRRADEIEAFNEELQLLTTEPDAPPAN